MGTGIALEDFINSRLTWVPYDDTSRSLFAMVIQSRAPRAVPIYGWYAVVGLQSIVCAVCIPVHFVTRLACRKDPFFYYYSARCTV